MTKINLKDLSKEEEGNVKRALLSGGIDGRRCNFYAQGEKLVVERKEGGRITVLNLTHRY